MAASSKNERGPNEFPICEISTTSITIYEIFDRFGLLPETDDFIELFVQVAKNF